MLGPVVADRERLDTLWDCDTGVMLRAAHTVGGLEKQCSSIFKTVELHTYRYAVDDGSRRTVACSVIGSHCECVRLTGLGGGLIHRHACLHSLIAL